MKESPEKKEASKNITKAGNPGTISFVYGEDQDFCTNTHNILPEENTLLIFLFRVLRSYINSIASEVISQYPIPPLNEVILPIQPPGYN